MLVFLDTEFTQFEVPELISIALVAEDGREFYAESTSYTRDKCSGFVRETVVPLLGRLPGAACTSKEELAERLSAWFQGLGESSIVVYDFATDWHLLAAAMRGRESTSPINQYAAALHLNGYTICHPEFEKAQRAVYTPDWPLHHALADARALMAGYRAWRLFMDKILRIE